MSFPYTPVPTNNPATITLPSDGDLASALSVDSPLADLADKVAHVNLPEQDTSKSYPLATQSIFRALSTTPFAENVSGGLAIITPQWGRNTLRWVQTSVSTANPHLYIPVEAADGSLLQSLFIDLVGSSGHGALPATKPFASLLKVNVATGVVTSISGPTTDGSASTAAYENPHQLALAVNLTVDKTFAYFIDLQGEAGANSQVGLGMMGVTAQFQTTFMDKGAS